MPNYFRIARDNPIEYKLSILILSLPNRLDSLGKLLTQLNKQSSGKPVQILYLGDNKSWTVGEKRNKLMSLANGKYFSFIDDDDRVSDDYVDSILEAIEFNPEVITFRVQKLYNGKEDKEQRFSHNYKRNWQAPDRTHYKMPPNHLAAWRKEIVSEDFPHKNLKEDHVWAEKMVMKITSSHQIDKILYFYDYSSEGSETSRR